MGGAVHRNPTEDQIDAASSLMGGWPGISPPKGNNHMSTKRSNIVTASRQWQYRPADQRFWTLDELYSKTREYANQSKVKQVDLSLCAVVPSDGDEDMYLLGPEGGRAEFQHYSFGQIAGLCEAPASYLRTLPAPLAAACLNNGLPKLGEKTLLFHQNGGLHLRCVTSPKYERIWNYEIADLAMALQDEGWVVPPARPCGLEGVPVRKATPEDCLVLSSHKELGIKPGDDISPAGLYASDHDCFIFQVNENAFIDGGDGEHLFRGVFWSNSEVGDARFRATMFLYETVCGNHIVWGAKTLAEVSIIHKGDAREMFAQAMGSITDRIQESASTDERRIQAAKAKMLGDDKDELIQFVYGKQFGLSKRECEDAYILANRHAEEHNNNPLSAWGFCAGVTRLSQQQYADNRDRMDRAAGKILATAF